MTAHLFYLPFDGRDTEADDLRFRIRFDDREPTGDELRDVYTFVGTDDEGTLENVFDRWNAGSGRECAAFARRECEDCDAVFTGTREPGSYTGSVDLSLREHRVDKHERATRASGNEHTVARGTRSLSSGDIVVVDGEVHLVMPIGWKRLEDLDDVAAETIDEARGNEVSA